MSILKYFGFTFIICMLITACQKDVIEADVKSIETHAGMPIEDMLFINDSVGYAVGGKAYNNGIILSTSDGGDTWITDTIIRHGLWAISKNENNEVNATGFSGNLLIKNPGQHWYHYRLPIYNEMTGTLCDREGGVFLCSGMSFQAGKIIHLRADYSIDTIFETTNEIKSLAYAGKHSLVAVGYGTVFTSDDSGKSWHRSKLDGDYFRKVVFTEPGTGYIAGFSGTLYKTTDGGKTWSQLLSSGHLLKGSDSFLGMAFKDSNEGYICGQYGLLMKTNDGGKNWKHYKRFTEDHLNSITFARNAVLVCSSSGKIYNIHP